MVRWPSRAMAVLDPWRQLVAVSGTNVHVRFLRDTQVATCADREEAMQSKGLDASDGVRPIDLGPLLEIS